VEEGTDFFEKEDVKDSKSFSKFKRITLDESGVSQTSRLVLEDVLITSTIKLMERFPFDSSFIELNFDF